MYIVLLHFARDIIPSTVVAVLSASLAILEELKHKNKSNRVLLINIETATFFTITVDILAHSLANFHCE